jgi:hypothetical protein
MRISEAFFRDSRGARFSLRGLVLAKINPRRLKLAPLKGEPQKIPVRNAD